MQWRSISDLAFATNSPFKMDIDLETVFSLILGFILGTVGIASFYALIGVRNRGELADLIRNNFTT